MVTVQEAVGRAIAFAQSVLDPSRLEGLRLEEVVPGDVGGKPAWHITLSMLDQSAGPAALAMARVLSNPPREYKTFWVNGETGEVVGMKIRELAGV